MADHRVAITGIGVVTAAGIGIEPFWQLLCSGSSAVGPIDLFDTSRYPTRVGGEVPDFSARAHVPKSYRKSVKVMARDIQLAVATADQAFRHSGLVTKGTDESAEMTVDPKRLGCNIGAGLICCELDELAAAAVTAVGRVPHESRINSDHGRPVDVHLRHGGCSSEGLLVRGEQLDTR